MAKMPAMNAVVEVLKDEGVDTAFGCPGAAILPLYKALEDVGGIEHLTVRHEEGATHMADGWSRTTGKVGVAIGTSGPAGRGVPPGSQGLFHILGGNQFRLREICAGLRFHGHTPAPRCGAPVVEVPE